MAKKSKVTLTKLRDEEAKIVKRIADSSLEVCKWSWALASVRNDIKRMMK